MNLPEKLKEKPVHRFGRNQFLLFRLPFPIESEVVGLIGSNGLGKTTALMILAGKIKPNLGESRRKFDLSELIKLFRGTELQNYLEKLKSKEIRISYKPQRVDKIPEKYSGKILDLLKKVDKRGILDELIRRFDLEGVKDKDIKEISGGELQRVAIAACLAKDADIYYLDEPTSFLDVFQRLNVSKAIREFCREKSVLVADHDLATLDFLADRIHIFYGVPSVYGIVSNLYSVGPGINAFLEGYIREDNVRIRTKAISFGFGYQKTKKEEVLVEFSELKKTLGSFKLRIRRGNLHKKEILGILGANALGKTTFARILAGEIKQDSGEIRGKVKISYKSQYPHTDFDGKVSELLRGIAKNFDSSEYKSEIIRPLNLERLLERKVNKLSGGELQRVAIAVALSKEADVYLLDEPSAFLDVEMRISLASLIRKLVEKKECSAMIIDHDLLFLSKIADRGMVFLGKPGKEGHAEEFDSMEDAFNRFLKEVGVTFRKDRKSGRPRANKPNSRLDREQKEKGKYFLS